MHRGKGGETIADTAKSLSTYGDGFMLRKGSDKKIEDFSENLTIPIINLLSSSSHPCQVLSDIFTVVHIIHAGSMPSHNRNSTSAPLKSKARPIIDSKIN